MTSKRILHSNEIELLFVKSGVYLHPSKSKKDNINGYLILYRVANVTNLEITLQFIPESQLDKDNIKKYNDIDTSNFIQVKPGRAFVSRIVEKPSSLLLSTSFSIQISYIYSIQFRPPSPGYYYGSIIINTQEGDKLPILFFHDDESKSTIESQKLKNKNFETFDNNELYWGAIDFLTFLKSVVNVQQSTIEPSVWLINPQSNDLRNFAPFKIKPKKEEESFDFGKFLNTAKWKVLETVATLSAKTKNSLTDLIDENAPKPIKDILYTQPEVIKIGDDFDSARIYLAKWAQQVKEEAERSSNLMGDDISSKIDKELSGENVILTQEEVNSTTRLNLISKTEWESYFDYSGRLRITIDELKSRIFHGGLSEEIKREGWLFLLEVYPWESSTEERLVLDQSYESSYLDLKKKWINDDVKRNNEFWKDQKFRIEKDINRTDRNLEIFKSNGHAEGDDEFDVSNITNPHLYKMREILITYNEYNENLGYVQGMSDLLSPLYVLIKDEYLVFYAFAHFMIRMERNFLRDQSGMKEQMVTLNKLLQFMIPDLYLHLEKCSSTDLFFMFRSLLVWFKREISFEQTISLWEVLFTNYYTSQFHLFIGLAILSQNKVAITELQDFSDVIKYVNDLGSSIKLDPLFVRAELLFLKFKRKVSLITRSETEEEFTLDKDLEGLLSKNLVIQKEKPREEGQGGG
ncbi:unnamed protein product [Candida verbasci]|uniref:Oxidant-induced cell-cycle arrest protein 5 n=1 Tax=Candida verbasci TaxID=1227364 RepID=A0A9W4TZF1_9ASCO|nr:unnamed protein product [Candida verbasci]